MASNIQQNRLGLILARECLDKKGFTNVEPNRDQGTYPHAHIVANRGSIRYFIGVSGRAEIGDDREPNPSYNIVKNAEDLRSAFAEARRQKAVPAFVTLALRREEGLFSAFFGTLDSVNNMRSIPMLPTDRWSYEKLANKVYDPRVAALA